MQVVLGQDFIGGGYTQRKRNDQLAATQYYRSESEAKTSRFDVASAATTAPR